MYANALSPAATFVHELVHACQIAHHDGMCVVHRERPGYQDRRPVRTDLYDYGPAGFEYTTAGLRLQAQIVEDWYLGDPAIPEDPGEPGTTPTTPRPESPYHRYITDNPPAGAVPDDRPQQAEGLTRRCVIPLSMGWRRSAGGPGSAPSSLAIRPDRTGHWRAGFMLDGQSTGEQHRWLLLRIDSARAGESSTVTSYGGTRWVVVRCTAGRRPPSGSPPTRCAARYMRELSAACRLPLPKSG